MSNPDHQDLDEDQPVETPTPHDLSRLSPHTNVPQLFEELRQLQVPCPWGDLTKGEGIISVHPDLPELDTIPYIPLGLVLGCGHIQYEDAYKNLSTASQFGKLVYTDIFDPRIGPKNYATLDLTNPENINLFGFKVHTIMSISVFTYDGAGVNFRGAANEMAAAKALQNLLMPGGIIANDNIGRYCRRFEDILTNEFGFKLVKEDDILGHIILQKPF